MKVIIKNGIFSGNGAGTGIICTGSTHLEIEDTAINGHRDGILITDAASLIKQIGLPANTPVEYVMEVIRIIGRSSQVERDSKLRGSQLAEFLGAGTNIVAIAEVIGLLTGLG